MLMLNTQKILLAIVLTQLCCMIQGTDHKAGAGVDPNPAVPPEHHPWLQRGRHLTGMMPDHAEQEVEPDLHPFLQRRSLRVAAADKTRENDQPPEQQNRNLLRRRKDDQATRSRRRARADDENRNLLRRRKSVDRKLFVVEPARPYQTENADEHETV
jgi:hypothetical protein